MIISVIGPQGSGKTTQAKLLAQKLRLPLLSMGNLLRKKARQRSSLGKRIKESQKKGLLVSARDTISVLKEELRKEKYERGFVLDGFPRKWGDYRGANLEISRVLYLYTSEKVAIQRLLKRGRADDTPLLIARRLSLYRKQTKPLISLFEKKGILKRIDASGEAGETFKKVWQVLKRDVAEERWERPLP